VPINPGPRQRGARPARYLICLAVCAATSAVVPATAAIAVAPRAACDAAPECSSFMAALTLDRRMAQDDNTGSDNEIPADQVEKYIAVYKDMQHDRSLTVEQAATKEGLSIGAFRNLEQKIERDEPTREHVREELQSAAPATAAPSPIK
jgi:hypothetical protein